MAKNTQEQNHNKLLTVVILAVVLLTIGQIVLYRNIQNVKMMISETAMEFKEGKGVKDRMNPSVSPSQKTDNGDMMKDESLQ